MQEAYARVPRLFDAETLSTIVATKERMAIEDARDCVRLYAYFISLKNLFPELRLVPPLAADIAWHRHMETPGYRDECLEMFGCVPAHTSDIDDETRRVGWELTKQRFQLDYDTDLEGSNLELARLPANCT